MLRNCYHRDSSNEKIDDGLSDEISYHVMGRNIPMIIKKLLTNYLSINLFINLLLIVKIDDELLTGFCCTNDDHP